MSVSFRRFCTANDLEWLDYSKYRSVLILLLRLLRLMTMMMRFVQIRSFLLRDVIKKYEMCRVFSWMMKDSIDKLLIIFFWSKKNRSFYDLIYRMISMFECSLLIIIFVVLFDNRMQMIECDLFVSCNDLEFLRMWSCYILKYHACDQ